MIVESPSNSFAPDPAVFFVADHVFDVFRANELDTKLIPIPILSFDFASNFRKRRGRHSCTYVLTCASRFHLAQLIWHRTKKLKTILQIYLDYRLYNTDVKIIAQNNYFLKGIM